jgi:hypothetical protein
VIVLSLYARHTDHEIICSDRQRAARGLNLIYKKERMSTAVSETTQQRCGGADGCGGGCGGGGAAPPCASSLPCCCTSSPPCCCRQSAACGPNSPGSSGLVFLCECACANCCCSDRHAAEKVAALVPLLRQQRPLSPASADAAAPPARAAAASPFAAAAGEAPGDLQRTVATPSPPPDRLGIRLHSQSSAVGAHDLLEHRRSGALSPAPPSRRSSATPPAAASAGPSFGAWASRRQLDMSPRTSATGSATVPEAAVAEGEQAASAAAAVAVVGGVETLELGIGGMSCATCAGAIEGAVKQVNV